MMGFQDLRLIRGIPAKLADIDQALALLSEAVTRLEKRVAELEAAKHARRSKSTASSD